MRIWYHFKCGCVVPGDKLKTTYIGKGRVCLCIEHREHLSHRSARCSSTGCGEMFNFSANGRVPRVCKNCGEALEKGLKGSVSTFIRGFGNNTNLPDMTDITDVEESTITNASEYIYCVHREECLKEAALKNKLQLDCKDCTKFTYVKPYNIEEDFYEDETKERCDY